MIKIFYVFISLCFFIINVQIDFVKCIGHCYTLDNCYPAKERIKLGILPEICGFEGSDVLVCCGDDDEMTLFNTHYAGLRKSDKKCKEIDPPLVQVTTCHGDEKTGYCLLPYGGIAVDADEFPSMAALGYGNFKSPVYRCGGVLIDQNIVITAAHCAKINGEPPSVVRIGSYSLSTNETKSIRVVKVIVHPKYDHQTYLNDIAILFMAENSSEKPACLYSSTLDLKINNRTVAVGFGTTFFGGPFSEHLIKVYMNIIEKNACKKEYTDQSIYASQLCVLGEKKTFKNGTSLIQDTCQGDSGGPLFLDHNQRYVIGIVSYGRGCGTEAPGIYTNITSYLDWIESIVWPQGTQNEKFYIV